MSNKYSSSSVSEDFPLYHNEKIPMYVSSNEKNYKRKISNFGRMISNEHPDIFRIKGALEGAYLNPFLNEVVKVDREEYYKKMQETGKKIKLIDTIKSSRKYSQNPDYLKLIFNDSYKKEKELIESNTSEKNNYFSLSLEDNKNNNFINNTIRTLDKYRIRFSRNYTKKFIDLDKLKKIGDNYLISQNDLNKVKNIHCSIPLEKSSYISNISNFEFAEPQTEIENHEFFYPRKPIYRFNPINNNKELFNPPPYIFPKWSNYAENFFMLSNAKSGLRKKAGPFSDYVNKNIDKIKVINNDIKKRLKQKKEEEKKKKFIEEINKNNNGRNGYVEIPRISIHHSPSTLTYNRFSNKKYRKSLLFEKMKHLQLKTKSYKSIFD